ncbi:unnamed protein product [Brassica oleracea var. botrytis]
MGRTHGHPHPHARCLFLSITPTSTLICTQHFFLYPHIYLYLVYASFI